MRNDLLVAVFLTLILCHGFQTQSRRAACPQLWSIPHGSDTAAVDHQVTSASVGHQATTTNAAIDQATNATIPMDLTRTIREGESSSDISRRKWLQTGAVLLGGCIVGGATVKHSFRDLAPVNFAQVAKESTINVTIECNKTCVTLDRITFQKMEALKLPTWVPPYLIPAPRVIKNIPNSELLAAAVIAGSVVEMTRTSLLYPLLTLKSRIQTDINIRERARSQRLHLKRRWQVLRLNIRRHYQEGKLYAGLVPSLLVSVPATGVYYGARDVAKRMLTPLPYWDELSIAIMAAFVADVLSLSIRTPADTLAIRLQVATGEESHEDRIDSEARVEAKVGNWFVESLERLPAAILTDLPYLLSRIALTRALLHGEVGIGVYEVTTIGTAMICGFLSTPFDVARSRILVDSDADHTNGIDGGSGEGLLRTMRTIASEGDGGIRNLFAGWLERTAYLGIGRAWLDPLCIIGYIALRDAILLEMFD